MNLIKQLISDGEQPSTMRVLALIIVLPVMVVWTVLSIRQNQFIIPDTKIVALVLTAIGGKSLQSFAENFSGSRSMAVNPNQAGSPGATTTQPGHE